MVLTRGITDKERLDRIKKVFSDDKEAREILAYDKKVDKEKRAEFDLNPEQEKVARAFCRTGTRKTPTAYNWKKPIERKPNATKGGLIAELAEFLTTASNFEIVNLEVVNKERLITFQVGEHTFTLTLVQNRKKAGG